MKLFVASRADEASVTIRTEMLRLPGWAASDRPQFGGEPVYECASADAILVTIPDLHLYHDGVDKEVRAGLRLSSDEPECVVFLSKHRAESGTRSLTVHPLGNFGPADLGGRPGVLVPTAPVFMTETLRSVASRAAGAGFRVTFEATHHGPHLTAPAFFYELGSGPADWRNAAVARLLAEAILAVRPEPMQVGIGIGGGHYVPRLTDAALRRRVAFGHLVPSHALPRLDDAMLAQVLEATPGASFAYLHRKALESADVRRIEAALADRGVPVLREADLAGPAAAQSSFGFL